MRETGIVHVVAYDIHRNMSMNVSVNITLLLEV